MGYLLDDIVSALVGITGVVLEVELSNLDHEIRIGVDEAVGGGHDPGVVYQTTTAAVTNRGS